MFLSSRMFEKGEVQTRAAAVNPMPPPVFTNSLFLAYTQTAVDDAAVGSGAYLSRSLALSTLSLAPSK